MAYPPELPPMTRTDSTISAGNHAQDHNRLASALADVLEELGANPAGSYPTLTDRLAALLAAGDVDATLAGLLGDRASATGTALDVEAAELAADPATNLGSALSASYAAKTGPNFFTDAAALKWGPAGDTGELTVRTSGDGNRSLFELGHAGDAGYIIHLTQKAGMGAGAALLGLGVDEGGTGLFVNNKKTGVGIMVTQNDTITSALAHGIRVNASSTVAPALWFGQGKAGAKAARFTANVAPGASQRLLEFFTTTTTASDTEIGYVRADNGDLVWTKGTIIGGEGIRSEGPTAVFTLYGTGGTSTANQRRFNLSTAYGLFIISAKTDVGGSAGDLLTIKHSNGDLTPKDGATVIAGTTTGLKIGGAATQKLGFYGATPVAKPTGVTVDAAGIHAALVSLGLIGA